MAINDEKHINPLRQKNPLAKFSSYTYSLTLGMIDPEGYNYFTETGQMPGNDSASGNMYIIAQSGGIDSDNDQRALRFNYSNNINQGLDVYIDNLNFDTDMLANDGSRTPTFSSKFSFDITEPIGFTLLTKLANLSNMINSTSPIIKSGKESSYPTLYQQKYLLIIKFYGYDSDGKVVSVVDDDSVILKDQYATNARIFPLMLRHVAFKVNGKATVYTIDAEGPSQRMAFGSKRGTFVSSANIQGRTVDEILGSSDSTNEKSLIGWLNANQQMMKLNENISQAQKYNISWIDNTQFKASDIKNSALMTNSEVTRETSGMANNVYNTLNVTVVSGSNARTTNPVKSINIPPGTPIVSVIDNIILKSRYVAGTLIKEVSDKIESQTIDSNKGKLMWYSVKPITKLISRDDTTKDWVCDITYEIMPYEVPYLRSQYVAEKSKYYGPVKKYDYIFMGSNTEVVDFSMTYDNLFFMPIPITTTKDAASKNNTKVSDSVPRAATISVEGDPNGGSINKQGIIAESVRANLYSLNDNAQAECRIMGDPDFIMSSIGHATTAESFSKLYAKNGSINPYGGQIFVEIDFKVAEDYKHNGLLDVDNTQTISFYTDNIQEKLKPQGLIFKVNKVHNSFSRGKFEQTLTMYMPSLQDLIVEDADEYANENNKFQRQQANAQSQAREREARANQTNATAQRLAAQYGNNPLTGQRLDATTDPRSTINQAMQTLPLSNEVQRYEESKKPIETGRILLDKDKRAYRETVDPRTFQSTKTYLQGDENVSFNRSRINPRSRN